MHCRKHLLRWSRQTLNPKHLLHWSGKVMTCTAVYLLAVPQDRGCAHVCRDVHVPKILTVIRVWHAMSCANFGWRGVAWQAIRIENNALE